MSPMQQMIYGGEFGYSAPGQYGGYNPYMMQYNNNMMSLGNYGYQPQQQNGYVFQPVDYCNYNLQPTYNQYQYAQPSYNYYNPYGNLYQNNYNNYSYNNYDGYRPFITPSQQQKILNDRIEMDKIKCRISNAYLGINMTEEELDRKCNPAKYAQQQEVDRKELEIIREHKQMTYLTELFKAQEGMAFYDPATLAMIKKSEEMHKKYDSHSLAQFMCEDFGRLAQEQWEEENLIVANRNLGTTYNSTAYNELLNMHRSSNPYINQLLDTAQYDNNTDDFEMGLDSIYDKQRRKMAIFEGKLPEFVSSEEAQKRRAEFTQAVMDQIYKKGAKVNV